MMYADAQKMQIAKNIFFIITLCFCLLFEILVQRKCKPNAVKLVYIAEAKPFFCKSTTKKNKEQN